MDDGFDRLLSALDHEGMGHLPLPSIDEPIGGGTFARIMLSEARDRGLGFEEAWPSTIGHLQPRIVDGAVEIEGARAVYEERVLLEDTRPLWHAAYEQRAPTSRERAQSVVASWRREDAPGRIPPVAHRKEAA